MSGFTIKIGNDILGPGGLEVDMARATPEQSKLAFERAARDAQTDDERIELGYRYLAEMLRGSEPVEEEEEEEVVVTKAVKKKTPAKTPVKETKVVDPPAPGMTDALLAKLMEKLDRLAEQSEPVEREPEPEPAVPLGKSLTQDDVLNALRAGFDTLGIPDLGPEPEKPQHKVTFDLGRAGKISSWYHWVSQQDQGLFLIYDTRFEYGTVYEPPNLGKDEIIRVAHSSGQEYFVHSLGFTHNFGVFSIVNLVIADKPGQSEPQYSVEMMESRYD